MDLSEIFEATTHAVPSPNAHYVASLTPTHLNIHYTNSLAVAASFNLPALRPSSHVTRSSSSISPASEICWSPDSLSLLLVSPTGVSVFGLADTKAHTRVSNGSGGLGRIAAAEAFGKNVVVVWEFGRVGICEMGRGRVIEIGELKTGIGGLRNTWSIRRLEGKVEVLAILSRTTAQDTLSLFLPDTITPHSSITLPTSDAQSLQWSPDGNWLSILDTPLSSPGPSVHFYTADGNIFRSWPQTFDANEDTAELGPHRQTWGPHHLALANSNGSTTLLNTKTFTTETILDTSDVPPASVYTETLTSRGDRSWKFSGGAPGTAQATSEVKEMKFNTDGTLLAIRTENGPETTTIWRVNTAFDKATDPETEVDAPTLLRSHTAIRKLSWHPRVPSVIFMHSEDNSLALWDAEAEGAPMCLNHHPFFRAPTGISSGISSSSSSNGISTGSSHLSTSAPTPAVAAAAAGAATTTVLTATFLPTSPTCLLLSARKKGWCLAYPFGAPDENTLSSGGKGNVGHDPDGDGDDDDDSQEGSLYDILCGRTPLPALKIRDDGSGGDAEDEEGEGEEDEGMRLDDTFRGKGAARASFEY